MIIRDEALVLRWFPVTDTSRVVVWFTRHHGQVSTLIKGAQRPKSWSLGQYDLFYTCELLFYARAREDLHMFRECSPLRRRRALRRDWRACAGASFVSDLLYRVTPPRAAAGELYDHAVTTLDLLAGGQGCPALLFWYELRVLEDLGLAPHLEKAPPVGDALFAYAMGQVLPKGQRVEGPSGPISGGVLALLRRLLDTGDPSTLTRLRLNAGQVSELVRHLDLFTNWHLDQSLQSRALALHWMQPAA